MKSTLIKDTTMAERIEIIRQWIPDDDGLGDDGGIDLFEMYKDFINGKREIKEINMSFSAGFYEDGDLKAAPGCGEGIKERL